MSDQTDLERRNAIHPRFVPLRCDTCDHPLREWLAIRKDDWNQFTCTNPETPHSRWIQTPHSAYVIAVNENDETPIVQRAIPPAVGGWCSLGGYNDFGIHPLNTIVDESLDEGNVKINGLPAIYLGQWVESEGVVMVAYYLVLVHSNRIGPFSKNTEASDRRMVNLWTYDVAELAFNANRLAFQAARNYITTERRTRRNRRLTIAAALVCVVAAFIIGAILF